MRIKKLFCVLSFFLLGFYVFSQVSVEPEEEFYSDVVSWSLKGYLKDPLPQLKPYPLNVVRKILCEVLESGDSSETERAEKYLEKYFSKNWRAGLFSKSDIKFKQIERGGKESQPKYTDHELFTGGLDFSGGFEFGSRAGFSFDAAFVTDNNNVALEDVMPRYVSNSDKNKLKPFLFSAGIMDFLVDLNANFTYGTEKFYGYAGFNKLSYGLYPDDSNVLNPSAYQFLNTGVSYDAGWIQCTQNYFALGAESNLSSRKYSLGKFMAFHSARLPFFENKISVSLYESSLFAADAIPVYLLPFPYVALSKLSGSNDNVFAGLGIEARPLKCIALTADAYVDDIDFSKFFKLKLNESAPRLALKCGFVYTPFDSFCSLVSCDYSLVSPYTYTYYDSDAEEYNWFDYTNFGVNLGSNLPPNSDRVSLRINFKPFYGLKISTKTSLVRHGNAYESLSDEEVASFSEGGNGITSSDGSIDMSDQGFQTATSFSNFLRQSHIMYLIQAGLEASYDFMLSGKVLLSLNAEYTFEYIRGDGVDKNIFSGTYSGASDVAAARSLWESSLHDSFNHYFSVGIKASY